MASVEAEVTSADAPATSERPVAEDTLLKETEVPPPSSEILMSMLLTMLLPLKCCLASSGV